MALMSGMMATKQGGERCGGRDWPMSHAQERRGALRATDGERTAWHNGFLYTAQSDSNLSRPVSVSGFIRFKFCDSRSAYYPLQIHYGGRVLGGVGGLQ
eukprot:767094-Hanusia_phi.AAC.3